MMKTLAQVFLLGLWLLPGINAADPQTRMSLLLDHQAARPGDTITAALRMVSAPGWHTYWRNPGDAGMAPTIKWQLPTGISVGAAEWPTPEKLEIATLFAYSYAGETLLLLPLKIAPDVKPGNVQIKGAVDWLECNDKACVPQNSTIEAALTIGSDSQESSDAALFKQWREKLPKPDPGLQVAASWESVDAETRKLLITWKPKSAPESPDFFPYEDSAAVGPQTEIVEVKPDSVRLRKTVKLEGKIWPKEIHGLVVNGPEKAREAFDVALNVAPLPGDFTAAAATTKPVEFGSASGPSSLLAILGFAFLGGLILNIMPCVLPVIALKILGFVNQSREEPRRVRELGLVYMLGVLASFLVLAIGLLAARKAAGDVNWGMQMQNPYFVVGMLVLVTLVALNLWGVFEITLPGQALGAAGELASREGRSGAFYNGVLATLLATPCTAPALGAAVGAVLTRPSHIVIITFLTIGFGLALPYVVLSWNPRWLKLLPKPGAWMEKFKVAMGFPMAATAVWLWSFGGRHFGKSGGLWLGIFLVVLALSAWIYGDFVQRGTRRRGFAMGLALAILVSGYLYAMEAKLHWREPQVVATSGEGLANEPGGIQWKRWSADAVAKARAEGRPVLVDFTADWCVTCQINKTTAIEVDSVKAKIKKLNVEALLADFTFKDPKIGAEIRNFGRAGVPLVVIYPADSNAAPILMPDGVFTSARLLDALDLAAQPEQTRANSE